MPIHATCSHVEQWSQLTPLLHIWQGNLGVPGAELLSVSNDCTISSAQIYSRNSRLPFPAAFEVDGKAGSKEQINVVPIWCC